MNVENTEKLLTAYPLLYRELREFGFECGDGWLGLILQVSADIESAARLEGIAENSGSWPSVGIVKHKLGSLRIQFTAPVSNSIHELVNKTREHSTEICELCAAPSKIAPEREQTHWVESLCDSCRSAHRPPEPPQDKIPKLPVWMLERNNNSK